MMYGGVPVHFSGLSVLFPGEEVSFGELRQPGACCVLSISPHPQSSPGKQAGDRHSAVPKGFLVTLTIEVKTFHNQVMAKPFFSFKIFLNYFLTL